jgi:hypothetical protein
LIRVAEPTGSQPFIQRRPLADSFRLHLRTFRDFEFRKDTVDSTLPATYYAPIFKEFELEWTAPDEMASDMVSIAHTTIGPYRGNTEVTVSSDDEVLIPFLSPCGQNPNPVGIIYQVEPGKRYTIAIANSHADSARTMGLNIKEVQCEQALLSQIPSAGSAPMYGETRWTWASPEDFVGTVEVATRVGGASPPLARFDVFEGQTLLIQNTLRYRFDTEPGRAFRFVVRPTRSESSRYYGLSGANRNSCRGKS